MIAVGDSREIRSESFPNLWGAPGAVCAVETTRAYVKFRVPNGDMGYSDGVMWFDLDELGPIVEKPEPQKPGPYEPPEWHPYASWYGLG